MPREVIETSNAPSAIGPYSQAIRAGNTVYCSGQIPIDPATGDLVTGDIRTQTERVMLNLGAVLEAVGFSLADVVRCTIYLADLGDFQAVNATYGGFFESEPPARVTVEVSGLPKAADVEISCIAVRA